MTSFIIKIIASICMLLDHFGTIFPAFGVSEIFRLIGRISLPIYAYMIAQGCRYTKNIDKYILRLGVFAIISEIPYDLTFYNYLGNQFTVNYFNDTNVFYTLFLGASCITIYEKLKTKQHLWVASLLLLLTSMLEFIISGFEGINSRLFISIILCIYLATMLGISKVMPERENTSKNVVFYNILAFIPLLPILNLANLLRTDYRMQGVVYILLFYFIKPTNKIARSIVMTAIITYHYAYPYIYSKTGGFLLSPPPVRGMFYDSNLNNFFFALLAVILIFIYNDKQGPKVKWIFYIFYPAHIAILGVIQFFLRDFSLK
ncbi:MAG: TraX family protein [Anaerocolumna aminovalerica]|uniref:TraX family protein n=1 Tax=Anaerocolumna aminovalerica TaxID=1527 RepID=UPI00290837CE|nr:TraX family protein [Anaerocolumna aminovalerica]MDU6263671.1 TraX family protein [Anaerocolumna aminovalerica]